MKTTGYWVTDGKNTGLVIKTHYNTFIETLLVISDDNDFMMGLIELFNEYEPEPHNIDRQQFNAMASTMGVVV